MDFDGFDSENELYEFVGRQEIFCSSTGHGRNYFRAVLFQEDRHPNIHPDRMIHWIFWDMYEYYAEEGGFSN
ncbi:MAG: hypothetical protein WC428_08075 [Candidatus Paceibacterota bacterium]|jgi:hypothetical protein